MNDKEIKQVQLVLVGTIMIVGITSSIIGSVIQRYNIRKDLIENNLAEYQINPKTGVPQFVLLTNQCNHVKTKE